MSLTRAGAALTTAQQDDACNGMGVPRIANQVARGLKVTATGDSITDSSQASRSYYNLLRYTDLFQDVGNFGIAGQRMDTILARAASDVLASGAQKCFVNGGVNDIEQGRSEALLRADVEAYWTACLAAGIEPLDWNLCPRAVETGGLANRRIVHNLWRQLRARQLGITHQDVWSRLAGASGLYSSGLNFDDIHPSVTGARSIRTANLEMLNPAFKFAPLRQPTDTRISDGVNTLTYGTNAVTLADSNSDGLADSFTASGSGGSYSITAAGSRASDRGKWQRCTLTGQTSVGFQLTTVLLSSLGWASGDRLAIGFGFRGKSDAGQTLALALNTGSLTSTNVTLSLSNFVFDETEEEFSFYGERTINAGSGLGLYFLGTGNGYFEINRPVVANLTKLGLA